MGLLIGSIFIICRDGDQSGEWDAGYRRGEGKGGKKKRKNDHKLKTPDSKNPQESETSNECREHTLKHLLKSHYKFESCEVVTCLIYKGIECVCY